MKRDFTLKVYAALLHEIMDGGYAIRSFEKYLDIQAGRTLILRHDVDKRPRRALEMARLEREFSIGSTYYFRIVPASFDVAVINQIAGLGHEIGYHYEDLALAGGDLERAGELFKKHLKQLRAIYPVKTICMHGSPLSRWDNRLIWQKIDYRDYDLTGEPYLDLDFNEILYLTDTGRTWNSGQSVIRDKVRSDYRFKVRSTFELIQHFQRKILPAKIMLTIHPQRWCDQPGPWLRELLFQNIKNTVKYFWPR